MGKKSKKETKSPEVHADGISRVIKSEVFFEWEVNPLKMKNTEATNKLGPLILGTP